MSLEAPSFDEATNTISIPENKGVEYKIRGQLVTGDVEIHRTTVVRVSAAPGRVLHDSVETEHTYEVDKAEPSKPEESVVEKPSETPEPVVKDEPQTLRPTALRTPQ